MPHTITSSLVGTQSTIPQPTPWSDRCERGRTSQPRHSMEASCIHMMIEGPFRLSRSPDPAKSPPPSTTAPSCIYLPAPHPQNSESIVDRRHLILRPLIHGLLSTRLRFQVPDLCLTTTLMLAIPSTTMRLVP